MLFLGFWVCGGWRSRFAWTVRARMATRESGRKGGLCDRVDSPGSAISAGKFDFSYLFFFLCWILMGFSIVVGWFCEFDSFKMNEYKEVLLGDQRVCKVKDFGVFVTVIVTAWKSLMSHFVCLDLHMPIQFSVKNSTCIKLVGESAIFATRYRVKYFVFLFRFYSIPVFLSLVYHLTWFCSLSTVDA